MVTRTSASVGAEVDNIHVLPLMNVYVFVLATFPINWDCDITPAEIEFPIIARLPAGSP
jgi:hypothetical protein